MEPSNWFAVHNNWKRGAFVAGYAGELENPARVLRGEEVLPAPMKFEHHMGARIYDWIATSYPWIVLVSGRTQQVLRDAGFTGWHTIPAVVHHNKQGILEGYGCLVVTGRAGHGDWSQSPLEQRPNPFGADLPHMVRVGLHVDFTPWDGSDICVPAVGVYVLVNRAVKDALVKAKITGVEFIRLDQYEVTDSETTKQLRKEMGYE